MCINIIRAKMGNLGQLVPLFNAYRIFYKQEPDLAKAETFLKERLEKQDSAIFMALDDQKPVGFTQLYPTFSSVGMKKFYILNDLYVDPQARKKGVATKLMNIAEEYAHHMGSDKIALKTGADNKAAQALYQELSYEQDVTFLHFGKEASREASDELAGVLLDVEAQDFV